MSQITSFRSIIELWPTREALRAAVGANEYVVSKWWQRNSIPPEWWSVIVGLPAAKEAGVTLELLADLSAREARSPILERRTDICP